MFSGRKVQLNHIVQCSTETLNPMTTKSVVEVEHSICSEPPMNSWMLIASTTLVAASKGRNWWNKTIKNAPLIGKKTCLLAWYTVTVCRRWNFKSQSFCSDPCAGNMQPNNFCATFSPRLPVTFQNFLGGSFILSWTKRNLNEGAQLSFLE